MIETQPPGLAAELQALAHAPATLKGPPCSIGSFLIRAQPATATALRTALDTPTITAKSIADTLARHGETVTSYTVARHRRRGETNGCRCAR